MKKILKALSIFRNAQFIFKKPSKKKIVIFDQKSEIYISNLFEKDEYIVLNTAYKIINIFIILRLIISFKKINFVNYYSELIKAINPKFVFTFIDNNLGFYKIKKKCKSINFIAIQNGTRFITGDILEELEKNNETFSIDHYFTFNESYSNIMSRYVKGQFSIIGSFKNNLFDISKNYQKGTICYISRMSDIFFAYSKNKNSEILKKKYKFWEIELAKFATELLKNINFFCKKKNLKLNIIGSSSNLDLEKSFYKDVLDVNSFNFFPKKNLYDSYNIIDQFEVCINPMSTFGYEAIAREKKVAFFSGDFIKGSDFIWPLNLSKKGKFYSNSSAYEEVDRILEYLISIDDDSWVNEISSYKKKLFYYDKNNSILQSFLIKNNIAKRY